MNEELFKRVQLQRSFTGMTWDYIADEFGYVSGEALRKAYSRYLKRQNVSRPENFPESAFDSSDTNHLAGYQETTTISGKSFRNVRSLEDLIEFFDVDTEVWEVKSFNVGGSEWDQSVKDGTVAQSVKITAHFVRRPTAERDDALEAVQQAIKDMGEHAPVYTPVSRAESLGGGDPMLFELAIHDPHFGMLAWGAEVGGESYDRKIAAEDYARAVGELLSYARLYNTERILYIVGHDMQHVNMAGPNKRGGTTASGTAQDVDGRISKIFTTIREAAVSGIDKARLIASVDVAVIPGNHDPDEMYKLGEVLNAWYRNDPEVNVMFGPSKRQYYGYGANAFMLTHGEEYKRKRDSLPLIMATECPADLWVASEDGVREVHTGHNHIHMQGGYYPTAEVNETRAIRTISLPGMTATDTWHFESGYKHRRAAMARIYRKSGGTAGVHEFNL
jgi:hypothetical protein